MKQKRVSLDFGEFRKEVLVSKVPFFYEGIGLMFKGKKYSKNLMFSFFARSREPIHSLFVFHKFLAIWCDENFRVIDVKVVNPWKFKLNCRREYKYLIEIPFNNFNIFSRRELDEVLQTFK